MPKGVAPLLSIGGLDSLPPPPASGRAISVVPRSHPGALRALAAHFAAVTQPSQHPTLLGRVQVNGNYSFSLSPTFSQSRQLQQGPRDSIVSFRAVGLKPLPLSVPSSFNCTSCYFPHYYAFMLSEIGCWKSMHFSDSSFPKAHLLSQQPDKSSFTQHNLAHVLAQPAT